MRRVYVALVFALCLALGGAGQGAAGPAEEIEGVIGAQIEAFQADDVATAFSFASPAIKDMFGSAGRFGAMVRQGYPMVWRPDAVRYLELRPMGGEMWQKVLIRDRQGRFHTLEYQMIEGDAGWQINGVRLLRSDQVGA